MIKISIAKTPAVGVGGRRRIQIFVIALVGTFITYSYSMTTRSFLPQIRSLDSVLGVSSKTTTSSTSTSAAAAAAAASMGIAKEDEPLVEDTAIIITSSWIQTHPTLYFINKVVESLDLIEGLSPTAPVYIAVDGLNLKHIDRQEELKRAEQIEAYTEMLYHKYGNSTHFRIVPAMRNLHISGNVQKNLALIEDHHPNIEFIYYVQHDFAFRKGINHTALVKAARENEDVRIVRFLYQFPRRERDRVCKNVTPIQLYNYAVNDTTTNARHIQVLEATNKYSDNNHFAKFDYYKLIMDSLGDVMGRSPEDPMNARADCLGFGMYLYPGIRLEHLDGRLTTNITE